MANKAIDKQYLIDSLKGFDTNILEPKYIRGVQKNGADLTPDANGKVNVIIDAAVQYKIAEQAVPESGYFKTYTLQANTGIEGAYEDIVGAAKINIPKDFVVKAASMKTVTAADKTTGGIFETDSTFAENDKYIDLEINTQDATAPFSNSTHLYINVKDLVDTYTAGNGIDITNNAITAIAKTNGGLAVDSNGIYIDFEADPINFATEWNPVTP